MTIKEAFDHLIDLEKRIKELEEKTTLQAQKQEKLLELYRELMTVKDELISLGYFNNGYFDIRITEANLEQQIKELEND